VDSDEVTLRAEDTQVVAADPADGDVALSSQLTQVLLVIFRHDDTLLFTDSVSPET